MRFDTFQSETFCFFFVSSFLRFFLPSQMLIINPFQLINSNTMMWAHSEIYTHTHLRWENLNVISVWNKRWILNLVKKLLSNKLNNNWVNQVVKVLCWMSSYRRYYIATTIQLHSVLCVADTNKRWNSLTHNLNENTLRKCVMRFVWLEQMP